MSQAPDENTGPVRQSIKSRAWLVLVGIAVVAGVLVTLNLFREADDAAPSRETAGSPSDPEFGLDDFFLLLEFDNQVALRGLQRIEDNWEPAHVTMLSELLRFVQSPVVTESVVALLEKKTGQSDASDRRFWLKWVWQQDYEPPESYASFKARLYSRMDTRFPEYFSDDYPATIRLDEIVWGGVSRDGIPPLKDPEMIPADEADYLDDSNVVFGVVVNGDARAYPKRILAHHEMVKDVIGGVSMNGVYCTLCGSMILYRTDVDGVHYELGTSGFLYRSNKLMYDHETKSLWSTLAGKPVVGPLVGSGVKLPRHHVVTTTWGEWRERHPDTKVLSLNTGHRRDYREGAAYRDYFATDELMFLVPGSDTRLKNKDEVLALRSDEPEEQLAISANFLASHPIYHDQIGDVKLVVLTDQSGANRVYATGGRRFEPGRTADTFADNNGDVWRQSESGLISDTGDSLERLPAHRAFWFGWHAVYPETRLVK